MIITKNNSTIKYPLSNSNNGYFLVCVDTKLNIKQLLYTLLMTQLGLLAYDIKYGLNLQQFIFLNVSLDRLILLCKSHMVMKINTYVKLVKNILLYINTTYTNLEKHIVYFKMTYTVLQSQSDLILFILNQLNVQVNIG